MSLITLRDQFLYDKLTEDDQEKSKVIEESDSTIPDPSHQTVTSNLFQHTADLIEQSLRCLAPESSRIKESKKCPKEIIRIKRNMVRRTDSITTSVKVKDLKRKLTVKMKKMTFDDEALQLVKTRVGQPSEEDQILPFLVAQPLRKMITISRKHGSLMILLPSTYSSYLTGWQITDSEMIVSYRCTWDIDAHEDIRVNISSHIPNRQLTSTMSDESALLHLSARLGVRTSPSTAFPHHTGSRPHAPTQPSSSIHVCNVSSLGHPAPSVQVPDYDWVCDFAPYVDEYFNPSPSVVSYMSLLVVVQRIVVSQVYTSSNEI
ncbi:hypothetical protein Tco_1176955 [Tanacetum coccineum]